MLARIRTEPAILSALVAAVIALVTAFGLDLTAEQVASIMAVTVAVLALFVRSAVTPTASLPPAPDAG